jgi:hypothetical protein
MDSFSESVFENINPTPPIGLYIWIISIFLLVILGVVTLVNLNIIMILKIKRMRKEDRDNVNGYIK